MPLSKLQFKPGINTEITGYTNAGGWLDCDKVRFRFGFPEKLGGWVKYSLSSFEGVCHSLHPWRTLNGSTFLGVGTTTKFYVEEGGTFNDVTPLRSTTTGEATFDATNGSTTLTVTDNAHGALVGDTVTFTSAATLGGVITAAVLNIAYTVVTVVDANDFTITSAVAANSSDTGTGGGSTVAKYQINVGVNTVVGGPGWGAGTWGRSTWGSASGTVAGGSSVRLWTQDNFGEDLIFNIRDGSVFFWDTSAGLTAPAVTLSSIAADSPTIARQILVSDRDRHVVAIGCNALGSSTQDKLLVRFSSQEDYTDWNPTATNTAGDLVVGTGSEIITAVETRREIIILTDASVHSMQYIGAPLSFGINQLASGTTVLGANSAVAVNDSVYWMGRNRFYAYDGQVQVLPCTVRDKVFDDFNEAQADKVVAGVNSEFGEVTWFYPSASSTKNDRYVIYNFAEKLWYFGSMPRTEWVDRGVNPLPIAASDDGYLYSHESGTDDDGVAIAAFIESGPIEIQDGEVFSFIRRLLPDINFLNSTSGGNTEATFTLKAEDFPGTGYTSSYASSVGLNATQNFVRLRGRSVGLRVESANVGVTWRLGSPRIEIRQDGRR